MRKYLAGAAYVTLLTMALKKAHDAGFKKGVKCCSILLQTAIDTMEIVEKNDKEEA